MAMKGRGGHLEAFSSSAGDGECGDISCCGGRWLMSFIREKGSTTVHERKPLLEGFIDRFVVEREVVDPV